MDARVMLQSLEDELRQAHKGQENQKNEKGVQSGVLVMSNSDAETAIANVGESEYLEQQLGDVESSSQYSCDDHQVACLINTVRSFPEAALLSSDNLKRD